MLSQEQDQSLTPPVKEDRDHILGPSGAPVTLVEYGDYECPHCGQAHLILVALAKRIGGRFRLVFRNFPLSQIHPYALRAAEAAEAAGAQGRFWEMHDMLFEHQDALDEESLAEYAREIGLDMPRFVREMLGGVHAARVREDFLSGAVSGVNGTPTFFINGRRHNGPWDLGSLAAAIEEAATETAEPTPSTGSPRDRAGARGGGRGRRGSSPQTGSRL